MIDTWCPSGRLNVTLACTAALAGAAVANHCRVIGLIKDEEGRVSGAEIEDRLTGRRSKVQARVVVNAGGPFSDQVRQLGDGGAAPIIQPSAGVHIVLPDYYSPESYGLIVPKTRDGRVVFMLPWLGHTVAGTTDAPCPVEQDPVPREQVGPAASRETRYRLHALVDSAPAPRRTSSSSWMRSGTT